jgi:hypothetical protein
LTKNELKKKEKAAIEKAAAAALAAEQKAAASLVVEQNVSALAAEQNATDTLANGGNIEGLLEIISQNKTGESNGGNCDISVDINSQKTIGDNGEISSPPVSPFPSSISIICNETSSNATNMDESDTIMPFSDAEGLPNLFADPSGLGTSFETFLSCFVIAKKEKALQISQDATATPVKLKPECMKIYCVYEKSCFEIASQISLALKNIESLRKNVCDSNTHNDSAPASAPTSTTAESVNLETSNELTASCNEKLDQLKSVFNGIIGTLHFCCVSFV